LKIVFSFLFAVLPSIHVLSQDNSKNLITRTDSLLSDALKRDAPGAAVSVINGGNIQFSKGYGLANLEYKLPITDTTIFDIASVAKQFTGMAITTLEEQGKLSLKDNIRKYIPELPEWGNKVTIDNLLHHTSGLRDWTATFSLAGMHLDDIIYQNSILKMVYNQKDLNFQPGSEHSYSNTGYNLLAEIVARITGQPFSSWMKENLFLPLGMSHTSFRDNHREMVPNKAYGYGDRGDGQYTAIPNNLIALGSSSLMTNAADMLKWMAAICNRNSAMKPLVSKLVLPGRFNDGTEVSYARGLAPLKYRGLNFIYHDGQWGGYNSFVLYYPEEQFSVAILSNNAALDLTSIAHAVVELYLFKILGPAPKITPMPNLQKNSLVFSESTLKEYDGTYKLAEALYLSIAHEKQNITATATGEGPVPAVPFSKSTVWVKAYRDSITFLRDENKRVYALRYNNKIRPKLAATSPVSTPSLADYLGLYFSDELKMAYRVIVNKEGRLSLDHLLFGIPLIHARGDEFKSNEWFIPAVTFARNAAGAITGFLVTQDRGRHQLFRKIVE
jgi:CubicO group peptidase (beta-lactamase class C family)